MLQIYLAQRKINEIYRTFICDRMTDKKITVKLNISNLFGTTQNPNNLFESTCTSFLAKVCDILVKFLRIPEVQVVPTLRHEM